MQAIHRLKENRDFRRVFGRGKSLATARFVLYFLDNRQSTWRAGFSVSKKVGNAVVRNYLKRRLRACFLELSEVLADKHVDFVVICRKPAADASFQEIYDDLVKLLRKAKFMV